MPFLPDYPHPTALSSHTRESPFPARTSGVGTITVGCYAIRCIYRSHLGLSVIIFNSTLGPLHLPTMLQYAAPEQLSQDACDYDTKVDIYALGVIFLELCYPFATLMERAKLLKQLRE